MNDYANFVEWIKQNTLNFNVIAVEDIAQETGIDVGRVNSYLERMEEIEDGFNYCYFTEQFGDCVMVMCEFFWNDNIQN